jgi:hypothetical protein
LSPNPATDHISIDLQEINSTTGCSTGPPKSMDKYEPSLDLEVYNLFGEITFKEKINTCLTRKTIDVSPWPSGMYYFRFVNNSSQISVFKVIKQ